MRIENDITNYIQKPSIAEMLGYELWELHEAAFMLTRWPDYIIQSQCKAMADIRKFPRSFIYEAAPPPKDPSPLEWKFNHIEMGVNFSNTFQALKGAIASGELNYFPIDLGINSVYGGVKKKGSNSFFEGEWISILLNPNQVIEWALLKGIYFSENLQKARGVYLIEGTINKKIIRKIKIKITAQFLLQYFPGKRVTDYSEHLWMKEFIDKPCWEKGKYDNKVKDNKQSLKKFINEILDPNPKSKQKGNCSDESVKNRLYYPKAIEEVVFTDSSGTRHYNVPLLIVAMKMAANVLLLHRCVDVDLSKRICDPSKKSLAKFLDDFNYNPIVSLYTKDAPQIILDTIRDFAHWAVEGFFIPMYGEKEVND